MDQQVNHWLHEARKLVSQKKVKEAAAYYSRVLESQEHPEALLHMSFIASGEDRYRDAEALLQRVLKVGVGEAPNLVAGLLHRLRAFNKSGEMRNWIAGAGFLKDIPSPQMQVTVSAQLSWLGDQAGAIRCLDRAIAMAPHAAQLHLARAQILMFQGRFDEAERGIKECLRLAPDRAEAWWTLAGLRKWTRADNHVDAIRKVLASGKPNLQEQANLQYALHRELDALGDIPEAFAALEAAGKARRATVPYDPARIRHVFARLKELALGPVQDDGVGAGFTPVFIVGMHRSGTTLLEQLMGGDPGVLNAGELHDVMTSLHHGVDHAFGWLVDDIALDRAPAIDLAALGRRYLQGVGWRLSPSHTHLTDKWPPNHANVGFILSALPNARVIHMQRDPLETCFSNLRELFTSVAPYSYDQHELADYYNQYRDLMAHWHTRFPGRILDVHYDDLTRDTEAPMRAVSDFCGLRYSDAMLHPGREGASVATASVVQVRDKVIVRSAPKWEPYAAYLQPLRDALR